MAVPPGGARRATGRCRTPTPRRRCPEEAGAPGLAGPRWRSVAHKVRSGDADFAASPFLEEASHFLGRGELATRRLSFRLTDLSESLRIRKDVEGLFQRG